MKTELNCPLHQDILKFVDNLVNIDEKEAANAIIKAHELADAKDAKMLSLGKTMFDQVVEVGLPKALVTRNCRQATMLKLTANNLDFDIILTREDAPPKPDPTALISIANTWNIDTQYLLYVGDYIYDRMAAENANMQWYLI